MAFEELKQRQSVVWGSAPFERVAATIADVHEAVVDRLDPQPGERVLDIGCGTGDLALLAAQRGAHVVGVDLSPVLIETAKHAAAGAGLEIEFQVGDAEHLEVSGPFDVAASTFGLMFAPDQQAAAGELARVVRPGGRIALATWRPEGAIGRFFKALAPFQPPPPEGAGSPLAWGEPDHVRALLGDTFDLEFEERLTHWEETSAEAAWELMSTSFGPIKSLVERLDPERIDELHRTYLALIEQDVQDDGTVASDREWLLVFGTRR